MIRFSHDPRKSWRDYQRVRFIKGFYNTQRYLLDLIQQYQKADKILHHRIDHLLETNLRELKDLSHILYRPQRMRSVDHNTQRFFDKILGTLWHELDKARDNVRLLESYTDQFEAVNQDEVIRGLDRLDQQILNAARKDLPRQLNRAQKLMEKLVPLFEKILPIYRDNEIVIRTIYFSRKHFDPFCMPSAVEYFFPLLFGSVAVGYFRLIRSLLQTKHNVQAQNVLEQLRHWVNKHPEEKQVLYEAEMEFRKRMNANSSTSF